MNTAFLRRALLASTVIAGFAVSAAPVYAQDDDAQADVQTAEAEAADEGEAIVVTGSRIARPNLEANSPIAVVTGEQVVQNADITLDTYLNTLPQVNPSGTTTSNNPGNGGQSNINLRGLGPNRNLILIDGRRPMASASDLTIDMNTIPQGLIERIDVMTGGAGAAYGADAISGVVNVRMKNNFQGIDLRFNYANSMPKWDAEEYQVSGTIGGNFADGLGNIALAVEYSDRQSLIKSQREFASQATSTTGAPPVGRFIESKTNPVTQSAITGVFATYGVTGDQVPTVGSSLIHFNSDGSLFGAGIFNNPMDVSNFRYPLNSPTASPNLKYFPDFYSYNFDFVNYLVLPLERKSAFLKGNYEISPSFDVFVQGGYTEYASSQALAPTPISVPIVDPSSTASATRARSALIESGKSVSANIIPVTNPFIPEDLRILLASRTGDDSRLTGSGATEPFLMRIRTLSLGLRDSLYENQVLQGLVGLRGDILEGWRYEASLSWGRTVIDREAAGNVNVQKLQQLLESPTGGTEFCAGGYNPFGIQSVSDECVAFLEEIGRTSTTFSQRIAQGFVTGDLAELPAGTMSMVLGAEQRYFKYDFDPGALFGPIAGFNTSSPAGGSNKFTDIFGEVLVPLARDLPWARELELTLGYRHSISDFNDVANDIDGDPKSSDAYKAELSWSPVDAMRLRASYQRSVRAPNFSELFDGGGGFPQIFDPCSASTEFRKSSGANGAALCAAQGVSNTTNFQATPGAQAFLSVAGNTNLKPETGTTITAGTVFNLHGVTASIDYYNIKVEDAIIQADPNMFISGCFNYHGGLNANLSSTNEYCQSLIRSGNDIVQIVPGATLGGDADGNFLLINGGKIKTSGVDVQFGYRLPTEFAGENSALNLNLLMNYLIDYKAEELPGIVLDYAGTASYFGAGLGTSFPRWKGTLNTAWNIGNFTLSNRIRYIHSMKNRASVQFPGETSFTGTSAVFYLDFAVEANVNNMTLRVGVNNALDKSPPTYSPNVQSGTDPSMFDVIGRRPYASVRVKF